MQWEQGWDSKGQKLGYNVDLQERRYRDKDTGRGAICQGWSSSMESVENGAEWHSGN